MASYCCTFDDVKSAVEDIRPFIHRTPLVTCATLDKMAGRKLFLKTENFQKTGSFKFRGATNAVVKLSKRAVKPKCVVTESAGNHGQALAKAAINLGVPCYVIMPDWAVESKVKAIEGYGANVIMSDPNPGPRAEKIKEVVKEKDALFISPSQDPEIIAGQGTTAVEILEDNPDIDVIVVPVGGGGLASGVALAAKAIKPSIKIVTVEPENANHCYESKMKGELISNPKNPVTIADGVRTFVGHNAWPIIRDLVDEVMTVTEEEIINGMLIVWERAKLVVEPTTGISIAAVMSEKFKKIEGENIAIVLCGGNIDIKAIPSLLAMRG